MFSLECYVLSRFWAVVAFSSRLVNILHDNLHDQFGVDEKTCSTMEEWFDVWHREYYACAMCYKKIGLKVLVFAGCLSLLCAESKDVDQKMTLVRELENAHRGLDGYLVAYEAVTPGRAAMRIVVAMDKKSAIFCCSSRQGIFSLIDKTADS